MKGVVCQGKEEERQVECKAYEGSSLSREKGRMTGRLENL